MSVLILVAILGVLLGCFFLAMDEVFANDLPRRPWR